MPHPKTRAERRKKDYNCAKKHLADAVIMPLQNKELGRFIKQDCFDCGNKDCPMCHGARRGKPIVKEDIEYE